MARSHFRPRRVGFLLLTCLGLGALSAAGQDPAPSAPAPVGLEPTSLIPAADEVELQYALGLALVRRGDLDAAITTMEGLLARVPSGELSDHIASDLERTRQFQRLRTRHLTELAANGGALRIDREGRELRFIVEALEDGRVHFRNRQFGVRSLSVSELDSRKLALQIPRDLDGTMSRWARLYPLVLRGEERGLRLLRRDAKGLEEGELLQTDAREWYPRILRLVDAAALLDDMAAQAAALDADSAQETLALIERLMAEHGGLEAVQRRQPELKALAANCLAEEFDVDELLGGLSAQRKRLRDGSVRLTYEFDAPRELEDFRIVPGYPPERIAALPKLRTYAQSGLFELQEGELVVAGSKSWRFVLPLEGSILLRVRLHMAKAHVGGPSCCFWMLGACDDGAGSYVALQELGTAMAIDLARSYVAYSAAEPNQQLSLDSTYELELSCDGETVHTKVNGAPAREVGSGGRATGEVFFLVHSDVPIHIERIEIETSPGGLAHRAAWLAGRLAELGFSQPGTEPTGVTPATPPPVN